MAFGAADETELQVIHSKHGAHSRRFGVPLFTRTFIAASNDHCDGAAYVCSDKHLGMKNFFIGSQRWFLPTAIAPKVQRGMIAHGLRYLRLRQRRIPPDSRVNPFRARFAIALHARGRLGY